jgi:hypothetical protein
MSYVLTEAVVWLNAVANSLGRGFFFIGLMPGWLSATLIASASGIGLLLVFKVTSKQRAIKRARRQIRASLLTVKLFFDSPRVGFRGQIGALIGALKLLVLAIVPILAMIVPVTLLLGQLGLWYQVRPLHVGEDAVVTLKLDGETTGSWPAVTLDRHDAFDDTHGAVRVASQREICWNLRAREDGYHRLTFRVAGQPIEKEIAVGDSVMRVSQRRPDWDWSDALLHPAEPPFVPGSPVRSIEIQYPARSSWTSGADSWMYYWFVVSLVAGFLSRGVLKVNI